MRESGQGKGGIDGSDISLGGEKFFGMSPKDKQNGGFRDGTGDYWNSETWSPD
jgi:hypothetical protein